MGVKRLIGRDGRADVRPEDVVKLAVDEGMIQLLAPGDARRGDHQRAKEGMEQLIVCHPISAGRFALIHQAVGALEQRLHGVVLPCQSHADG
jgi:hypothetical protein